MSILQQYLNNISGEDQIVIKQFFLGYILETPGCALFPTGQMAKRLTYNIITGNDPHLGMCLYYSPHFELNIWRRASSLTGERTKKDPAFKGFRQSSSRLKEASPIAASLYKLVPKQVKQYSLYRTLTGEAIKMLKEGIEIAMITETLKKKYIDPLPDAPNSTAKNRTDEEPMTRDRLKGMNDFASYPQIPSGIRKITRTRRSLLFKKITEGQSADECFSPTFTDPLQQTSNNVLPMSKTELLEEPKRRTKTTSDLIYLGRLPECKKLKMWLRPVDSSLNSMVRVSLFKRIILTNPFVRFTPKCNLIICHIYGRSFITNKLKRKLYLFRVKDRKSNRESLNYNVVFTVLQKA